MEDKIKDAFVKVKEDNIYLQEEINKLQEDIAVLKKEMINLCEILSKVSKQPKEDSAHFESSLTINPSEYSSIHNNLLVLDRQTDRPTDTSTHSSTHNSINSADNVLNSTDFSLSTHSSTHNYSLEALKKQNYLISTGNEGVQTDRQTDRQTDQQTQKEAEKFAQPNINPIENASQLLDSLDSIKKEIRLKFKRLTSQELSVFSAIYQLEEEKGFADYRSLSNKLSLTESSVRDYISRLIKKGIPVEKNKINNKTIHIEVSKNLKKVASLSTILQLIDI